MNYSKPKRGKGVFKAIVSILVILLLALAATTAITQGFTNFNPYGWLEEYDRIAVDDQIEGFEICSDFEVDFDALIEGATRLEIMDMPTASYTVLKTDNDGVYIKIVEVSSGDEVTRRLSINGHNVYSESDGWNESEIAQVASFDVAKVLEIHNADELAHYIGAKLAVIEEVSSGTVVE